MHTQFKHIEVDDKKVTKFFGCSSFKPVRGGLQISPAIKNKWNEDWVKYWFYHKVPLVEEKDRRGKLIKRYPLAAKMSKNSFDCKPSFENSKLSKTCEKAYTLTASIQGARDLCEEYIAARIWPLASKRVGSLPFS